MERSKLPDTRLISTVMSRWDSITFRSTVDNYGPGIYLQTSLQFCFPSLSIHHHVLIVLEGSPITPSDSQCVQCTAFDSK